MMVFGDIREDSPLLALPILGAIGVYMAIGDIWLTFFATVLIVVAIALHGHGKLLPMFGWLRYWLGWVWNRLGSKLGESTPTPKGVLHIGRNLDTAEKALLDVSRPQSLGLYAQSGGGKSTLIETFLCEITTQCSPQDLKLCISDPSGVDYRIWDRSPHLAYPVVNLDDTLSMLQWVKQEKEKRETLYNAMPRDRKCNDLSLYHQLRDELKLNTPRLPVIVVILDEIQDVTVPGSESEAIVKDLARTGRKFGIVVWGITQRNTVSAISRDIQQQQQWKLVGYMPDNQDYATVARVPKEVYSRMKQTPGRFMAFIDGGWFHVQIRMIKTTRVETIARTYSLPHAVPFPSSVTRPQNPPQVKQPWQGSNKQKKTAVVNWLLQYQTKPTPEQFLEAFDASRNTAVSWVDKCWPIVEKKRTQVDS